MEWCHWFAPKQWRKSFPLALRASKLHTAVWYMRVVSHSLSLQLERHRASYDDMSWHLSINSFMSFCFDSVFTKLRFYSAQRRHIDCLEGGHGRQSEWSLQAVWVALKSFETQGQGGSAIRLDTDKSTDKKDIQKKTRILSNDVLWIVFLILGYVYVNPMFNLVSLGTFFSCEESGKPRMCKLGQSTIRNFGLGKMRRPCFTQ